MYSVLNKLSEYIQFNISINITSYAFLLVVKIAESLQCILEVSSVTEKIFNEESFELW